MKIFFLINLLILLPVLATAQAPPATFHSGKSPKKPKPISQVGRLAGADFSIKLGGSQGDTRVFITEGHTRIAHLETEEFYNEDRFQYYYNAFSFSTYDPIIIISSIDDYDARMQFSKIGKFGYKLNLSSSQRRFNWQVVYQNSGDVKHRLKLGNILRIDSLDFGLIPYYRLNFGLNYLDFGYSLKYGVSTIFGNYYKTGGCVNENGNLSEKDLQYFIKTNCDLITLDIKNRDRFFSGAHFYYGYYGWGPYILLQEEQYVFNENHQKHRVRGVRITFGYDFQFTKLLIGF